MATVTSAGRSATGELLYNVAVTEAELRGLYHGVEFTEKDLRASKDTINEVFPAGQYETMLAKTLLLKRELIPTD